MTSLPASLTYLSMIVPLVIGCSIASPSRSMGRSLRSLLGHCSFPMLLVSLAWYIRSATLHYEYSFTSFTLRDQHLANISLSSSHRREVLLLVSFLNSLQALQSLFKGKIPPQNSSCKHFYSNISHFCWRYLGEMRGRA